MVIRRLPIAIRSDQKYYPSNTINRIIVNAITGEKYPYRVGSKDSLRLYKVTDTTGAFTSQGKKKNIDMLKAGQEKEPNCYYFDNPGEYMQNRHFHRDSGSCESWREYQKSLIDSNDVIDISKYNDIVKTRLCLKMKFTNKIENPRKKL